MTDETTRVPMYPPGGSRLPEIRAMYQKYASSIPMELSNALLHALTDLQLAEEMADNGLEIVSKRNKTLLGLDALCDEMDKDGSNISTDTIRRHLLSWRDDGVHPLPPEYEEIKQEQK